MPPTHQYAVTITWTGNLGTGAGDYHAFEPNHMVSAGGKPVIEGTADPAFRGVPERWNPDELLVAALSQCHMLWFLALCASRGIAITGYVDHATGTMVETLDGGGHFDEVVLRPEVTLASSESVEAAVLLHSRAHDLCYVANSVNFEVRIEPSLVCLGSPPVDRGRLPLTPHRRRRRHSD